MKTIITQTKQAQPMGAYTPTSIDARKANADFLLVSVSPYFVKFKGEDSKQVTKRELTKMQSSFTWETDF